MSGKRIKKLLSDMSAVLRNSANGFDSGYHISAGGTPYVHVIVDGERYQFAYFGRNKHFRIFDSKQNKTDIVERNDVIKHFRTLAGKGNHDDQ